MFFDQIQIVTTTVKTKHRYLISPFHHCSALLAREQVYVLRHELSPYYRPDVFFTPLQLFHKLPGQFFSVRIANMSRRALEGVANAHRNRHVHVLVRQRIGRLFSLRAVVKRLRVVENRMRV